MPLLGRFENEGLDPWGGILFRSHTDTELGVDDQSCVFQYLILEGGIRKTKDSTFWYVLFTKNSIGQVPGLSILVPRDVRQEVMYGMMCLTVKGL